MVLFILMNRKPLFPFLCILRGFSIISGFQKYFSSNSFSGSLINLSFRGTYKLIRVSTIVSFSVKSCPEVIQVPINLLKLFAFISPMILFFPCKGKQLIINISCHKIGFNKKIKMFKYHILTELGDIVRYLLRLKFF